MSLENSVELARKIQRLALFRACLCAEVRRIRQPLGPFSRGDVRIGDFAVALGAYEQVHQLGVSCRLDVRESTLPGEIAYRLACCYASLGDKHRAVDGLAAALSGGFGDLERPRQDEWWQGLRG